jgi:hypothetical protein
MAFTPRKLLAAAAMTGTIIVGGAGWASAQGSSGSDQPDTGSYSGYTADSPSSSGAQDSAPQNGDRENCPDQGQQQNGSSEQQSSSS